MKVFSALSQILSNRETFLPLNFCCLRYKWYIAITYEFHYSYNWWIEILVDLLLPANFAKIKLCFWPKVCSQFASILLRSMYLIHCIIPCCHLQWISML